MNANNNELQLIRQKIDVLDQELLNLLNERAQYAIEVGKIKIQNEGGEVDFYRPEREAQVLKNLIQKNKGPLPEKSILAIFHIIMTECRNTEIAHHSGPKA